MLAPAQLSAQSVFGLRISRLFVTAMPVWMYNGFTETAAGEPVQGSEVSPIRMSFGAGLELRFTERMSFEPQGWLFMQEYIALNAYEKTVPTQIETGSSRGDVANTFRPVGLHPISRVGGELGVSRKCRSFADLPDSD
jgi:hypothetical protein